MNFFSAKHRTPVIEQLNNSSFDVLIIGGGITGAGIALDATARGLKVALIEMQDFSSGTSGRSTKLIHGGLRYLKQMEFKLVAEVGKEREIIHRIAPHLTKPEQMLLPIIKNGSLGKFSSRLGMWLYELLARVKKEEKHKVLDAKETLTTEPLLKKDNLLGGILFYEYRTDDSRLTIEVIKEAVYRGALAINYMKATAFIYNSRKIIGAKIQDKLTGEQFEVKATYTVNATGPWIDELDDLDKNSETCSSEERVHKLHITKGVHIVVDRKKLPIKQSIYFDTFDKRMVFIIPREGKVYIGTTDTFYKDEMTNPKITKEDKEYLLKCVNDSFPSYKINLSDIESCWAGLRPLIHKPGKNPSEISRRDEIFTFSSGLITIAGGKLTAYRKMAQRTVDVIAKKILATTKNNIPDCTTHQIQISGGKIKTAQSFSDFLKNKTRQGVALGLSVAEAENLTKRYGSNVYELYTIIKHLNENEKNDLPISLRAQLIYAIEKEMCITLCDFFIRRTGILYFDIETVKKWKDDMSLYMQKLMGWDDQLTERYRNDLQKSVMEMQ